MNKKIIIFTDGGARGNPGPAGIGACAYDESKIRIFEVSEFIGVATNNQAEYRAVIAALKKAKECEAEDLCFYLDSELVVRQLNREYKVKDSGLAQLFLEIHNLSMSFKKISFSHVPREMNQEADLLANKAMDRGR